LEVRNGVRLWELLRSVLLEHHDQADHYQAQVALRAGDGSGVESSPSTATSGELVARISRRSSAYQSPQPDA
jgi:hypothetical protein